MALLWKLKNAPTLAYKVKKEKVCPANDSLSTQLTLSVTVVLKQGGNAVDSAIASALCIGVISNHATGKILLKQQSPHPALTISLRLGIGG